MHCNWGWGGCKNGYFNLVTMNGFDTWNSALLDLIPEIYVDPLALYEFEVNDMTATFIDLSEFINESEIAIWSWDFGDGTTQDNTYGFAEHTYSQSGEYTVSLNVTNIYGETGQNHFETITIGSSLSGDVNGDSILNILESLKKRGILLRDCRSFINLGETWFRISLQKRKNNIQIINTLKDYIN